MKKLVLKTLLFLALFLLAVSTTIFVVYSRVDQQAEFKINNRKTCLILGHSHPERAFVDSLIPGFVNLSHSGESYFYTLIKLRKLIAQNKQIDAVFLEFSNDLLDDRIGDWIWGDVYLKNQYHTYAPFMNAQEQALLFKNNPSGFAGQSAVALKKNFMRMFLNDQNYLPEIGGYKPLYGNMKGFKTADTCAMVRGGLTTPGSIENMDCLKKIRAFCKANKLELILIRSPLHAKSPGLNHEKEFQAIREKYLPGSKFLDFVAFPLSDEDFADSKHLNKGGAEKFSRWFAKLNMDELLLQENIQQYIDEEIDRCVNAKVSF